MFSAFGNIPLVACLLAIGLMAGSKLHQLGQRASRYRSERDRVAEALTQTQSEYRQLNEEHIRLQAAVDAERAQHESVRHYLETSKSELHDAFSAASSRALEQNSDRFMQIAMSAFEHQKTLGANEHLQRVETLGELVKPLQESLASVDRQFHQIERNRIGTYESLRTQVEALNQTTNTLSTALKAPKTRGRWGEMHLRRVAELAGMQDRIDFATEVTVHSDAGRKRPDMVVHMPSGGCVVVDAKTPLDSFARAMETNEGDEREGLLTDHARRVKDHVKELSSKQYQQQFAQAPEFAVLFIPSEAMFSAAIDADPSLLEFAFSRNVHISSPVTFISILRGVAQGWHQKELAESAQQVSKLGKELHDRIMKLTEHWGVLARHLTGAVGAYNESVRSMEARLVPTARRLAQIHTEEGAAGVVMAEPIMIQPLTHNFTATVQPVP